MCLLYILFTKDFTIGVISTSLSIITLMRQSQCISLFHYINVLGNRVSLNACQSSRPVFIKPRQSKKSGEKNDDIYTLNDSSECVFHVFFNIAGSLAVAKVRYVSCINEDSL